MSEFYADAILHHYRDLSEHLQYDDIMLGLVPRFVVTIQEKQDLGALQVGGITRSGRLLDLILDRGRDLEVFTSVLRDHQPHLADLIEGEGRRIQAGERLPHLKVVEKQFRSFYRDTDFQLTEKLPGEDFVLDVSDESQLLPLNVTVETADKGFIEKQKRLSRSSKLQYRYKHLSSFSSSLECVFDEDLIEGDNRLYICTGIAGVGKTVTVHRLAWQWANDQNKYLKRFQVLIVIPLSKVDCSQSLMEILSDNSDGPGYIKVSQHESIKRVLEKHSEQVLFVIDGGDEVKIPSDKELSQLINGGLYPKAKVLIMARPDIHSLAAIADLNPDVKIHIHGTSPESMSRYIEASLVSEQASTDVIREFKKLVLHVEILQIPLYLAMVSILFDHHWDDWDEHFRIPKTMTDVLNTFMCVIIKIWLQKTNRTDEMKCCTFRRCVLEKGSQIPIDIRAKLVNMGRMGFECLLSKRYSFSDEDLEKYLIDRNDIKACGMFRLTKGPLKEFCFIHQIFQQYLSALYISHMQLTDALFLEHITKTNRSHGNGDFQPLSIETLFSPLELCIKFIFGMCPELGRNIMKKILPLAACCVNQKMPSGEVRCLDLEFEAELCRESGDCSLVELVEEFVLGTEAVSEQVGAKVSGCNFETGYAMLTQFSEQTCIALLDNIYNLTVSREKDDIWCVSNKLRTCVSSPERQVTGKSVQVTVEPSSGQSGGEELQQQQDGWCILNKIQLQKEPSSSLKGSLHEELFPNAQYASLTINNLDITCFCLLLKFRFPEIQKLVVLNSVTLDSEKLRCIFPNMRYFEASGNETIDVSVTDIHAARKLSPEEMSDVSLIEHVKIHGDDMDRTAPLCVTTNMFQSQCIKSMYVARLYLTVPEAPLREVTTLGQLTLSDCAVSRNMDQLCDLIRKAPNLTKLHLHNTSGDMCDEPSAHLLMTTVVESLPKLQHLALVHVFRHDGVSTMFSFIQHIKSLRQLSLGELDLMEAQACVNSTCMSGVLLHVYIWYLTRKHIRKVVGERKVKVKVSPLALPSPTRPTSDEFDT